MNEAMKFLESPGVITTVGLMAAIIGLAAVNIIQTVMFRTAQKRMNLNETMSGALKKEYQKLLGQHEDLKYKHANCTDTVHILKNDNTRLNGIVKSLREQIAEIKNEARGFALNQAMQGKKADQDHAEVVNSAKAYYRFLIGKA